jgi:hypothetical protein
MEKIRETLVTDLGKGKEFKLYIDGELVEGGACTAWVMDHNTGTLQVFGSRSL